MKILFLGTPSIAVPYLEALAAEHDVVGLICKKDEPVGRGYKLTPPPTKVFAEEKGIPIFQPEGPWTEETFSAIEALNADVGVAVAYGRLVPDRLINAPKYKIFNIHFSLLPKYRGAGPMQWSLIKGEKETGVTAFWIVKDMDAGPICGVKKVAIDDSDDAFSLQEKLVPAGIEAMRLVLKDLGQGKVVQEEQQGEPTFAPLIKKEMADIDWSESASTIRNKIRGMAQWPVARAYFQPENSNQWKMLKIFKAEQIDDKRGDWFPGTVVSIEKNKGPVVGTSQGRLLLTEVQPEGKKKMSGWAFLQGARLTPKVSKFK